MRRAAAALLLGAILSAAAAAQQRDDEPRAGRIALGPRLLEYPVDCVDPRGCRLECFQQGTRVISRGGIGLQDEIRLVATATTADEVRPLWIEIRPFDGNDVQTLLLAADTLCELRSLVISPKNRP